MHQDEVTDSTKHTKEDEHTMALKNKKLENRRKILQQIEFYFSDSNLSKDRFLKQEILNSPEGCLL